MEVADTGSLDAKLLRFRQGTCLLSAHGLSCPLGVIAVEIDMTQSP